MAVLLGASAEEEAEDGELAEERHLRRLVGSLARVDAAPVSCGFGALFVTLIFMSTDPSAET